MGDEEFRYWLSPVGAAELWVELDRQETLYQQPMVGDPVVADELMAETEAVGVWREVAADVTLAELGEAAPNPWRERRVPPLQEMLRVAS